MLSTFLVLTGVYLVCGVVFALPFLIKGVKDIDDAAVHSPVGFRLIILPGVIVLWPLLLKKWINVKKERV